MSTQRDLQVRLQERYRRIRKANYNVWEEELGYLIEFITQNKRLFAILQSVDDAEGELDPAAWLAEHMGWRGFDLPRTNTARVKLVWYLVHQWAEGTRDYRNDGRQWFSTNTYQEMASELTEQFVEPLVEFLVESLGTDRETIYLLARYCQRVEWFARRRLYEQYVADTKHGEDGYDRDLREFLFDQGIDYPFSQPQSPSGEADVVAWIDTSDPLVCEVKLYDGVDYGVGRIASGVQQAVRYARDYGKTVGHVVVFNLSDKHLSLPTDEPTRDGPPCLHIGGVTVYLFVVQALPLKSASTQGRPNSVDVTRDQLVSTVEDASSSPTPKTDEGAE